MRKTILIEKYKGWYIYYVDPFKRYYAESQNNKIQYFVILTDVRKTIDFLSSSITADI